MKRYVKATTNTEIQFYHATQNKGAAMNILDKGLRKVRDPFGINITDDAYHAEGYGRYVVYGKFDPNKFHFVEVNQYNSYDLNDYPANIDGLIEPLHSGHRVIYHICNVDKFNDICTYEGFYDKVTGSKFQPEITSNQLKPVMDYLLDQLSRNPLLVKLGRVPDKIHFSSESNSVYVVIGGCNMPVKLVDDPNDPAFIQLCRSCGVVFVHQRNTTGRSTQVTVMNAYFTRKL